MTCTNPNCRHQTKRKLRPLVISLIPSNNTNNNNGNSRHEQIIQMFTTHSSLAAHFESPIFSPGVPSRDLRGRLKFLEHANRAGLIPDMEWKAICKGLREQCNVDFTNDDDNSLAEDDISSILSEMHLLKSTGGRENEKQTVIDPFRYLATETLIQPEQPSSNDDDNNPDNNNNLNNSIAPEKKQKKKKKHWLQYKTTSLIPISPDRQGSPEDISVPVSVELWRKAKTLNRDRSVLACTLAHLTAMKTLVGEKTENDTTFRSDTTEEDAGFDFILEDNVRAFVGIGDSCECANRIWDMIEGSNDAPSNCHLRYFGWLGSSPNLRWVYNNHLPRSAVFNMGASLQSGDDTTNEFTIFPFPTNEDFELDGIATSKSKSQQDDQSTVSSTPHFSTPGGTAVFGTFAYTVSTAAYHTLINHLQNDIGSLMWKGKRMRAYQAKPIDKILPRHVKSKFGPRSIHLPSRPAFVRGPMLGSLLHPQWEEGFCKSTELQYQLSCFYDGEDGSSREGSDVWDHVWLTNVERDVVSYRKETGKWLTKNTKEGAHSSQSSVQTRISKPLGLMKVVPLAVIVAMMLYISLTDAFVITALNDFRFKRSGTIIMLNSPADGASVEETRERGMMGKVPIISRTIPIEIKDRDDVKRLDVTVWEMDKPSDLIQEWWSIGDSERSTRVGDPFGVVMWPGSILASKELMKQHIHQNITNATVLVLGAGTGVEAQTASLLGAKKVIGTDINPLTLKLLEYGSEKDSRIGDAFEARYFDLFSDEALPECDILIAADVLYNPDLAMCVGRRLHEAIVRSFDQGDSPTKIILTDSQQFHGTNFLEEVNELKDLNSLFKENGWEYLKWETYKLNNVSGSGVLIDEDQTYDVDVRMICWGW